MTLILPACNLESRPQWIDTTDVDVIPDKIGEYEQICSNCGAKNRDRIPPSVCPNCKSKMMVEWWQKYR